MNSRFDPDGPFGTTPAPRKPIKPLRDPGITQCLSDLAERAKELGEPETAIILNALVGSRAIGQDGNLAKHAQNHSKDMLTLIDNLKNK